MSLERDYTSNLLWFFGGALIGASAALLLAPESGRRTRRNLARKGNEVLGESGRELFERGRDLYERGREIAEEAAEIFERGRRLAEKKIDEAF